MSFTTALNLDLEELHARSKLSTHFEAHFEGPLYHLTAPHAVEARPRHG